MIILPCAGKFNRIADKDSTIKNCLMRCGIAHHLDRRVTWRVVEVKLLGLFSSAGAALNIKPCIFKLREALQ